MTKARDLADYTGLQADLAGLQTNITAGDTAARAGRKNFILNGSMQVAQRSTSSTANGFVSLDRWYVNQSGGSTTFSQETNTSPSETGGIKSYARLNVSSSSDYTGILQRIEDVTSVPSGTVTLSFWAKGTAPVGGLYVYTTQDFGTGGSADVDIGYVQITASLTSSWVKYSTQITIPSVDGKTINSGSYLILSIVQGSNTSSTAYDLNITGVQLELGSGTDFEHRSFGEELQLCQRYYQKTATASGVVSTSSIVYLAVQLVTEMRAVPTWSLSHPMQINDVGVNATQSSADFTAYNSTTNGTFSNLGNFSGLTAFRGCLCRQHGGGNTPYMIADAEL